jgi:hypothetical protein
VGPVSPPPPGRNFHWLVFLLYKIESLSLGSPDWIGI